ncbi:MAG TPA: glycosyltransferase family 2 protein, partial [Rhizomicrobium sp.]|nr:glycosyltransferase family 2 protein [Rhizomicrobium sp.]
MTAPRVAVLIPCYNEEAAIAPTVRDFRASLPDAEIYVYDNNSTDQTIARAREVGAIVRSETRQGKGNVVRRQFADIDADVYVLVDGDDTYDASVAPELVKKLIDESLDIVSGQRIATGQAAYRPGHVLGNRLLTGLTALMFDVELKDMLTGYRIMSRRFVKSFPFTASGFAVETELTVHAVRLLVPMVEVETAYKERPAGSVSKLSTWGDGFRILFTIAALVREERPLIFFTSIFVLLATLSLILGVPVVVFFLQHGTVPKLPTAILASVTMLLAFL